MYRLFKLVIFKYENNNRTIRITFAFLKYPLNKRNKIKPYIITEFDKNHGVEM